jgi:imidazolonepropionase-like amidohydrolase
MLVHVVTGVIAAGLVANYATGQTFEMPAEPQSERIAIVGGTVHPVSSGAIANGYVVFDNGHITAVDSGSLPADLARGTRLVDASGKHVYPGLISTSTILGLEEIGQVSATQDQSEYGTYTPEVRAITAVNPSSALIPVARANGILTAVSVPQGGTISGFASIIRMDGWTTEEMSISDRAGLAVRWPYVAPRRGGGRRFGRGGGGDADEQIEALEELFATAATYRQARSAEPTTKVDLRLDSLGPVLAGEVPLYVFANDAAQIRSAVAWAGRRGLGLVIVGGSEADQCTDLLNAQGVSVIVQGVHRMPRRRDAAYDDAFTLPMKLQQAGVSYCIASGEEPAHERSLPYHAGTAAGYGLSVDDAIRSITLSAAEIIGIGATHGSIEVGKVATLIVTTGNPLEITSDVVDAYIDGSKVDLDSRHKALDRKYRARYGQP